MTVIDINEKIKATEDNIREVVDGLKRLCGLNDRQLGQGFGKKGNVAQARRTGVSDLTPGEIAALADFFGVPIELFYMEPTEALIRAMQEYGLPRSFHQRFPSLRCMSETAGQAA